MYLHVLSKYLLIIHYNHKKYKSFNAQREEIFLRMKRRKRGTYFLHILYIGTEKDNILSLCYMVVFLKLFPPFLGRFYYPC